MKMTCDNCRNLEAKNLCTHHLVIPKSRTCNEWRQKDEEKDAPSTERACPAAPAPPPPTVGRRGLGPELRTKEPLYDEIVEVKVYRVGEKNFDLFEEAAAYIHTVSLARWIEEEVGEHGGPPRDCTMKLARSIYENRFHVARLLGLEVIDK